MASSASATIVGAMSGLRRMRVRWRLILVDFAGTCGGPCGGCGLNGAPIAPSTPWTIARKKRRPAIKAVAMATFRGKLGRFCR